MPFFRSDVVNVHRSQRRKCCADDKRFSNMLDNKAGFLRSSADMKTTTLPLRNSMNRSPVRAFVLIPLVLACFALSAGAEATCQEGCDISNANTFLGEDALINNTTGIGIGNTATGYQALFSNTTGFSNTANGAEALTGNTTGSNNTATGTGTLQFNITGAENTANGDGALGENTTGSYNTASGAYALEANTNGVDNTATGVEALIFNSTGSNNTATGASALEKNTTGNFNTATGVGALLNNTTGSNNIALGVSAGTNLTTGSNNIDIGNVGVAAESRIIRVGKSGIQTKTFIAGISGVTVPGGVGVIVGSNGQLGTVVSSERYKEAIKPMDKASETILAVKPVTFRYKHDLDPAGIPQFGLVAEQVEKVNPALVARDEQGKPYTVRYDAVNAMLLNEFLKEHRKVEEQQATIAQLKSTVAQQQKGFEAKLTKQEEQIETLTAGLQKVSAQLEASKPAPQVVNNP
jgi:Chaperone of endosialidase